MSCSQPHQVFTGIFGENLIFVATEDGEEAQSHLLPDFWLRPAWLWQAGSLSPLTIFLERRGLLPEKAEDFLQMLGKGPTGTET